MSESFVTQCPRCSTSFRVNQEQLGAARGAVRCGACDEIFNAAKQLREAGHAIAQPPTATSAGTEAQTSTAEQSGKPTSPSEAQQNTDKASPSPSGQWQPSDIDDIDLDLALATLEDQEQQSQKQPPEAEKLATPASQDSDPSPQGQASEQKKSDVQAPAPTHKVAKPLTSVNPDGQHNEVQGLVATRTETETSTAASPRRQKARSSTAPGAEHKTSRPTTEKTNPGHKRAMDPLLELHEEPLQLDLQAPAKPWGRRILWGLLIVLASLALCGQYLAYNFADLARQDQYRPWFARLCPLLGCNLPAKVDIDQIRSSNLVVRSHPDFSGALVVDAILYNRAPFSQPFPLLEMRFADINGRLIASRRFKPSEYLAGDMTGKTEMPPQVPVHIALDILDPGPHAVNYSLNFHSPQ